MKKTFTYLLLILTFNASAQVICGTAGENGIVTLTAPPNNTFTTIEFASYGTPTGACNSFAIGACHAANSLAIAQTAFIGQNSASLAASNGVFGDPCGGTVKRLYIQARYSSTLPLHLTSFKVQNNTTGKSLLSWTSSDEVNTSHFSIERSTDGITYTEVGSVAATGSGEGQYNFSDITPDPSANYYYRLKMIDLDGRSRYSSIARISGESANLQLSVFPNPATETITILSDKAQEVSIVNTFGQLIKTVRLVKGSQVISIAGTTPGIYFIKSSGAVVKFVRK
jgi:hypothetical protein